MSSTTSGEPRKEFDRPLAPFLDNSDLPLAGVLTTEDVHQVCTKHSVLFGRARNVIFTPFVTLWTMLSSVVSGDKSCSADCVRVSVLLVALSRPKWSEDTGVLCRARARMPVPFLQQLAETLADRLEQAAPAHWTHALGYNLVRKVMAQAALYQRPSKRPSGQRRGAASEGPLTPRQISFKAAMRQIEANAETLSTAALEQCKQTSEKILTTLASKRVGKRPGRQEPRAIKRRPTSQAMLNKPRAEVKKAMAEGKTGAAAGIKERRK